MTNQVGRDAWGLAKEKTIDKKKLGFHGAHN